jgi:hypothetical protein
MKAYDKVLSIIKQSPEYGHVVKNMVNVHTLTEAKKFFENQLNDVPPYIDIEFKCKKKRF